MTAQVIKKDGDAAFAVLPIDEYNVLIEKAEMADDIAVFDVAMRELEDGQDEVVPAELAEKIIAGESLVKVWREYRGLSQGALAKAANVTPAYISQIESGKKEGTVSTLKAISRALNVDLDDLVPE